jgi:GH18 family chitinase
VAAQYNVDYTVKGYLAAGVPSNMIVMGAPIYGRAWSGVNKNSNNGLFASATGAGQGTWEQGSYDYADLLNKIKSDPNTYQLHWDDQSQVPYIWAPNTQNGLFSTFESAQSISTRVDYIKANSLGGIMFWEASADVRNANSPDSLIGTAFNKLNA